MSVSDPWSAMIIKRGCDDYQGGVRRVRAPGHVAVQIGPCMHVLALVLAKPQRTPLE
jgi:hypothetical protein